MRPRITVARISVITIQANSSPMQPREPPPIARAGRIAQAVDLIVKPPGGVGVARQKVERPAQPQARRLQSPEHRDQLVADALVREGLLAEGGQGSQHALTPCSTGPRRL